MLCRSKKRKIISQNRLYLYQEVIIIYNPDILDSISSVLTKTEVQGRGNEKEAKKVTPKIKKRSCGDSVETILQFYLGLPIYF